jgi:hypothetical protein
MLDTRLACLGYDDLQHGFGATIAINEALERECFL